MKRALLFIFLLFFSCEKNQNKEKCKKDQLNIQENIIKERFTSYHLDLIYPNDTTVLIGSNTLEKLFVFLDKIEKDTILKKVKEDNMLFCIEGNSTKTVTSKLVHERIKNIKEAMHLILGKYDEYRPVFKTVEEIKYGKSDSIKIYLNRLKY